VNSSARRTPIDGFDILVRGFNMMTEKIMGRFLHIARNEIELLAWVPISAVCTYRNGPKLSFDVQNLPVASVRRKAIPVCLVKEVVAEEVLAVTIPPLFPQTCVKTTQSVVHLDLDKP
jgi:hypothetical protein